MLEADSAGMALLTDARAGDSVFVRVKATGPLIESTYYYDLEIDLAVRIAGLGSESDEDGIVTQAFAGTVVHDDDLGYGMSATLINTTVELA